MSAFPESDWEIRPATGGPPVDPLSCETARFERQGRWTDGDVAWGNLRADGRLAVTHRVDGHTFTLGETARVRFRNRSNEPVRSGNVHKFNLEVLTTDGWMDVRGWPGGMPQPITDEAVELAPNEFYEWTVPLTEQGVLEASFPTHQDDLAVCPALQPGRYRFCFSGIELGAVAVAFDVTAPAENQPNLTRATSQRR